MSSRQKPALYKSLILQLYFNINIKFNKPTNLKIINSIYYNKSRHINTNYNNFYFETIKLIIILPFISIFH
uniref:Uncharacterized protein n=1 Tax=Heterorhabditis bacteriophora TaxID=37862 RepID=A0A1I7WDK6_HETBA